MKTLAVLATLAAFPQSAYAVRELVLSQTIHGRPHILVQTFYEVQQYANYHTHVYDTRHMDLYHPLYQLEANDCHKAALNQVLAEHWAEVKTNIVPPTPQSSPFSPMSQDLTTDEDEEELEVDEEFRLWSLEERNRLAQVCERKTQ